MKPHAWIAAVALFAIITHGSAQTTYPALPALNIDIDETSVSGLSAGGFMAVQLAVAYSSIIKGVGVVAGGPFYCSQGNVVTATTQCSCTAEPASLCHVTPTSTDVSQLVAATKTFAQNNLIDDPANLVHQRVITLTGADDDTVPTPIVTQLQNYFSALGVPSSNTSDIELPNAGHTMPTLNYGVACSKSETPFIGKCQLDGAGKMLGWIYGPAALAPPAKPAGRYIRFDQTRYLPADRAAAFAWTTGMDTSGWVYVPAACAAGAACRLHVALHGCEQGQDYLPLNASRSLLYGTTFVRNAGYTRWADSNRIVVLFPQAVSIPGLNPNGCWDWWGYSGPHFADQQGVQMQAIRNMIGQLTSGASH